MNRIALWSLASLALVGGGQVRGALMVNAARPITDRVDVHLIAVADDDGTDSTAGTFGNVTQQGQIFSLVDTIFAQAGVDVNFTFSSGTLKSSFARTGTIGSNNPRSSSDLATIRNLGASAGVLSSNTNAINMFMVTVVPGFGPLGVNNSAGIAYVGGATSAYFGGSSLLSGAGGREVLASVLSHEIGHNLGLNHSSAGENLMTSGAGGERLDATQIATILASKFSVAVPAPATDGDFNNNNFVDGTDFLLWQRGGSPNRLSSGDLGAWRTNFGDAVAVPAVGAVPEPGAVGIVLVALAGLTHCRRRIAREETV